MKPIKPLITRKSLIQVGLDLVFLNKNCLYRLIIYLQIT